MIGGSPSVGSSPTFAGLTLTGQLLAVDGSVGAPTYSFTSDPDTGIYRSAGDSLGFSSGGVRNINFGGNLVLRNTTELAWAAGEPGVAANDVILTRDDANVLALRNGTNAQESRNYARFTSTSDYGRRVVKWATTTLSAVTGASVTATGLVPARAQMLDGVISKVTTALGTTNGTTGYAVGTVGDPNQWGDIVGTATTTASGTANFTASPNLAFSTAAQDVVVTAAVGNFNGTGAIYLAVPYSLSEAD